MEQMSIVIVGHVDHGKSTVIGRLLADTASLPEGKLEAVKRNCAKNSKPFEYAFLLDALEDEQSQGITIDTARCFFKTQKRNYIILDAPGHIEFLKNMVTGASRAEAALLVIDAHEGIQENSRRHGQLLSMLGISQVSVLVNKMDLVDYSQEVFSKIQKEFTSFLNDLGVHPISFIPISARDGENLTSISTSTGWYSGLDVLSQLDSFTKSAEPANSPFRLPVQDVYKFTAMGDSRRIIAGTVSSGTVTVGDQVRFLPSGKESTVASVEGFNIPEQSIARVGQAIGVTLSTQIYVTPGEVMVKTDDTSIKVSDHIKANIFWVGKNPLFLDKEYKLKIHNTSVQVRVEKIRSLLDSSNIEQSKQGSIKEVARHEVAEIELISLKPIAYDLTSDNENTGRFVIIDNYEIAGGGIILDALTSTGGFLDQYLRNRQSNWEQGLISTVQREALMGIKPG